jgi:hypothetical protein
MTIDGKLHTVPLRLLMLVIEGTRRKVALFRGVWGHVPTEGFMVRGNRER